ncbi:hypothetical protein FGG08_006530 [Glutinoglossum americanum]|uniref:NmrA-like domain-containing protein n=1 Tax=Glutinoglossum americanum TaxID=1670608 RepID=A0A9P8I143_9PEZI|nr:hypothetical protein FGG08_006530 [Glutinoglossum americanum]
MSKIITVFGATGVQGGSVVAALLHDKSLKIRAITRNVNSEAAKSLKSKGVELATADLNDENSLAKALEGSNYIFAVTDFFEPFASSGPEAAIKVESAQGINLARAASRTPTLEHYIWSTLPNGKRISGGKYLIPHFESKNIIDDYIKQDKNLFPKTTFVWFTFYAANYLFPMFTPNFVKSSGKHVQIQPSPPNVPIYSIGDAKANVGIFVRSILNQPGLTLGKFVLAYTESLTVGQLLENWSAATGKPSVYVQTSLEDFDRVWPMWGHEMGIMMKFWEEAQDKSWSGEEGILTKESLSIKDAFAGSKKAFESIDWTNVVT